MESGKEQKIIPSVRANRKIPLWVFLFLLGVSMGAHFLRVGWGDFYRLGLFQVMEDDHLSSYALYWSDPGLFENDVIRERALTMTAGSIQRWLPVLTGGFLSPGVWSQFWALFQEVGLTAAVFSLAWLASRERTVSVLSSLLATTANPSAWNWSVFSGGFLYDYPASAALVVALFTVGLVLQDRWKYVPFWSLLCALLHPSIGLWVALLLSAYFWCQPKTSRGFLTVAILAGPCLVAVGQILVGSWSPVTDRIGGREFQDLCRLNWHLQPWWEPSHGVFLARLANAFLPCSLYVVAALADRDFQNDLRPTYLRMVRCLTVGAWAGFLLGVLFFYTGFPTLILSSPSRLGAVWAYASLPLLVAYFAHLVAQRRVLDGSLALVSLAGLVAWDDNVFLRYPTSLCTLALWARQLCCGVNLRRSVRAVSLISCSGWLLVLLLETGCARFPQFIEMVFPLLQSLRPLWTVDSWRAVFISIQKPEMAFFYGGCVLLLGALPVAQLGRRKLQLYSFLLLVGVLLLGGAWNDRKARTRMVAEAEAILKAGQALPEHPEAVLTTDNRSLRFLLQRPVFLLGFYNNNTYARSLDAEKKQRSIFKALQIPYPKTNADIQGLEARLTSRLDQLMTTESQELKKLSGASCLLKRDPPNPLAGTQPRQPPVYYWVRLGES